MSLPNVFRTFVAALLLATPLAAHAQFDTLPGMPKRPSLPAPVYTAADLTGPVRAYVTRGCGTGYYDDEAGVAGYLTAFCAAGRLSIGQDARGGGLVAWLDVHVARHPLIPYLYPEGSAYEFLSGELSRGEACPETCAYGVNLENTGLSVESLSTLVGQIDRASTARFVPTSATLSFTYGAGPEGSPLVGTTYLEDATFTPIPEPATWALLGTGVVALGAVAGRWKA